MQVKPLDPDLTELVYYLLKLFPHLHIEEMALLLRVAVLPTSRRKAPDSYEVQRAARQLLDTGRIRLTKPHGFEVVPPEEKK